MHADLHSSLVAQFNIGAVEEVQAWVRQDDGHPFIDLHLQRHDVSAESSPSRTPIRIPATLLSELKRLVSVLKSIWLSMVCQMSFKPLSKCDPSVGHSLRIRAKPSSLVFWNFTRFAGSMNPRPSQFSGMNKAVSSKVSLLTFTCRIKICLSS
jgi:hypothetical protein